MHIMQQRSLSSPPYIYNSALEKFINPLEVLCIYRINKDKYGLTLIEVMITIAILSACMLALANMQVIAFQVSTHSDKLMRATTVTQDTIETLMAVDFNHISLADPTPPGEFTTYALSQATLNFDPPAGISVQWNVDDSVDGTKLINITTTWQNSGDQKSLSLPLRRTPFQ